MNATLEDRLRRHYDERTRDIPWHGPGLEAYALVTIHTETHETRPRRAVWVSLLIGSAAAATLLALFFLRTPSTQDPAAGSIGPTLPSASSVDAASLAPVETLPLSADVSDTPATVAASAPTDWYRLQPDLDVAWYQEPGGASPSMLCWRTPVDSKCLSDASPGALPLVVPTAGGQTLVVTVRAGDQTTLDVQLGNGTVLSAPIQPDSTIGWGVARYMIPAGERVTAVGDAPVAAPRAAGVPDQTLPPTAGLNDIPVTIAAGEALSYWRWLPDLDIAERQTAEGGTELCWRTPAGTGCLDDAFISPAVGVVPTAGGAILLARPGLVAISPAPTDPLAPKFERGPLPTTITLDLSDGSRVTTGVNYGEEFGVGYGRVTLAAGVTVMTATSI